MSVGPLRRLVGLLGLVALAPTALMLVTEQITPRDAALRAVITLLLTMGVGRLTGWCVGQMVRGFDAGAPRAEAQPQDAGRRRAGDLPAG